MITIKWPAGVPSTEVSQRFLQRMVDRMATSFFKYGAVAQGFPSRVDALATLRRCVEKYEQTGNAEYLVDAANYAMIESMHPRFAGAHFTPLDSKGSAGRHWHGEIDASQRANDPSRWND
jgi:hypothetical protein